MNKKGITLVALSITILVMIILGTAAVGSVIGIINLGRKDGFEATSRIVREQIEVVYRETMNKKESDEDFDTAFRRLYVPAPFSTSLPLPASAIPQETLNVIVDRYSMTALQLEALPFYRVNTLQSKKILGIENSQLNFYVNFDKNIVFTMSPVEVNEKNVYTLEEIDLNFKVTNKTIDISQINIGDIILYDPTKGVTDTTLLTYISPIGSAFAENNISGNGHSSQALTATSSHNQYIVIGKENGKIKMMSRNLINLSGSHFNINNGQGLLYYEEELHKMCSIFGHGIGADKSMVTTYTIGNPAIPSELKTKKIRDSGARSIMLEDLEVMSATNLRANGNSANPTVNVYVPTLLGQDNSGMSEPESRKSNLLYTYKATPRTSFVLRSKYSSVGLNNIFLNSYHIANRAVNTTESSASFITMAVDLNNILGDRKSVV